MSQQSEKHQPNAYRSVQIDTRLCLTLHHVAEYRPGKNPEKLKISLDCNMDLLFPILLPSIF